MHKQCAGPLAACDENKMFSRLTSRLEGTAELTVNARGFERRTVDREKATCSPNNTNNILAVILKAAIDPPGKAHDIPQHGGLWAGTPSNGHTFSSENLSLSRTPSLTCHAPVVLPERAREPSSIFRIRPLRNSRSGSRPRQTRSRQSMMPAGPRLSEAQALTTPSPRRTGRPILRQP